MKTSIPKNHVHLWLAYVVDAYARTCGRLRVVVDYDEVMAQPVEQLRRMAKGSARTDSAERSKFNGTPPVPRPPDLRHSVLEPADVNLDDQASDLIAKPRGAHGSSRCERIDLESDDVPGTFSRGRMPL